MGEGDNKRHVGISFIGNSFSPIAAIVTAPILTHSLSVDDRGLVAGATAPLLFAVIIGTLGIPEAVTHFIAGNPKHGRLIAARSLLQVLVVGALATGVLFWTAPLVGRSQTGLTPLIQLCTISLLPGLVTGLLRGAAAGQNRWTLIATEKLVSAGSRLVLISGFAIAGGLNAPTAALIMAFSSAYGILVYCFGLRHSKQSVQGSSRDCIPKHRRILGFGLRVWMGATAGVILSRIDQVLLPSLSSLEQLAFYAVAVSIGELASVLVFAIRDVSFRSESEKADIKRTAGMARFALFGSSLLMAPIILLCPWWIPLVFGEEYAASVVPTMILLFNACLSAPGSIAGAALSGRGKPEIRSYAVMIAALVNIGLLLALGPSLGAVAAAIATLAASMAASGLCLLALTRITNSHIRDFYQPRRSDLSVFTSQSKVLLKKVRGNR